MIPADAPQYWNFSLYPYLPKRGYSFAVPRLYRSDWKKVVDVLLPDEELAQFPFPFPEKDHVERRGTRGSPSAGRRRPGARIPRFVDAPSSRMIHWEREFPWYIRANPVTASTVSSTVRRRCCNAEEKRHPDHFPAGEVGGDS